MPAYMLDGLLRTADAREVFISRKKIGVMDQTARKLIMPPVLMVLAWLEAGRGRREPRSPCTSRW